VTYEDSLYNSRDSYGIMGFMPPSPDTLPNYHFLLIAPNLGAEWLFDAARAYWERFRPTVVSDLELIRLIPTQYTVAVSVIARRDTASQWGVWIAQATPDALLTHWFLIYLTTPKPRSINVRSSISLLVCRLAHADSGFPG